MATMYSANLTRIEFNWDNAERLYETFGDTTLRTDRLYYSTSGGTTVWGASSSSNDYDSTTDTSVDSPWDWIGPQAFNSGTSYIFRVDMDKNSESPANYMLQDGLIPADFGVTFEFDNGCLLVRTPVPRTIATPTPSCDLIYSNLVRINGDDFEIRVRNDNRASAYLTYSTLTWPSHWSASMFVDYFTFQGNRYFDINTYSSPVSSAAPNIELPGNMTQRLWEVDFGNFPLIIHLNGLLHRQSHL